ncbi:hypothetical protein [Moorena producens]|uniref:hypothetical protein n=1 Tax=Moorena producens TaxID=1155739 RepID=UPI003C736CBA
MNNRFEVVFDARAEEDVDVAAEWYAKKSSEAALGFLTKLAIHPHPLPGWGWIAGRRQLVMTNHHDSC